MEREICPGFTPNQWWFTPRNDPLNEGCEGGLLRRKLPDYVPETDALPAAVLSERAKTAVPVLPTAGRPKGSDFTPEGQKSLASGRALRPENRKCERESTQNRIISCGSPPGFETL